MSKKMIPNVPDTTDTMIAQINKKSLRLPLIFLVGSLFVIFISSLLALGQDSDCKVLFPISTTPILIDNTYRSNWGYIDCKGNEVIKPAFEQALEFGSDIGVLMRGSDSFLVSISGGIKHLPGVQILTPYAQGVAIGRKNGKYYIFDTKGAIAAHLPKETTDSGEPPLPFRPFSEGLAPVDTDRGIGYIDVSGRFAIPPRFGMGNSFIDGMATVLIDQKSAVIDKKGRFIVSPDSNKGNSISDPSDGLVTHHNRGNGWKYFNKHSKMILEVTYDFAGPFIQGLAGVNQGAKWGFINKKGIEVVPLKFDGARSFADGLAAVQVNKKWGFIDKSGRFVIKPFVDSVRRPFQNGLAYVQDGEYEGYIDKKGKWVWKRRI